MKIVEWLRIWGIVSGLVVQVSLFLNWLWWDFNPVPATANPVFETGRTVLGLETAMFGIGIVGSLLVVRSLVSVWLKIEKAKFLASDPEEVWV